MSDLWRPGDDVDFRTEGEGAGQVTNIIADETGSQIRLLRCTHCGTLEELPDYQGRPEEDHVLDHLVMQHNKRHPHVADTKNFLFRVSEAAWKNPKSRRPIHARIWADQQGKGFVPEYYAAKNTFMEDASKCHTEHNRQVPCIDWHNDRKRIGNPTKEGWDRGAVKVYLCDFCPVAAMVMQAKREAAGQYDN